MDQYNKMSLMENINNFVDKYIAIKNRINFNLDKSDINYMNFKKKGMRYMGVLIILIMAYLIFNTKVLSYLNVFTISVLALLGIIGMIIYQFKTENADRSNYKILGFFVVMIVFMFISIFFYQHQISLQLSTKYIIILFCVIVLIGLAFTYKLLYIYLNKQRGIVGFIINLIFFIPCLLNDFIEYIKYQYQITTNTTLILLVLEIIFILIYLYSTNMVKQTTSETSLLKTPVFLDKEYVIADSAINLMTKKTPNVFNVPTESGINRQINNYGISFWVYINQNDNNNSEFNILNYGDGKPHITYQPSSRTYKFILSNNNPNEDVTYTIDNIPYQRWNFIVVNYYETSVDIIINGRLITTKDINTHILTHSSTDNIIIGQKDGIIGSMCNVHFYNSPLKKKDAIAMYNLLRLSNPPV